MAAATSSRRRLASLLSAPGFVAIAAPPIAWLTVVAAEPSGDLRATSPTQGAGVRSSAGAGEPPTGSVSGASAEKSLPGSPETPRCPAPPATPKRPVVTTYHGVKVTDNYQWLESWSDPAVRRWSEAQNEYARAYLDGLPMLEAIHGRLEALLSSASADYSKLTYRGGLLFAIKQQPPKEQPFLVSMTSPRDAAGERVVVDPNLIDPGGRAAIDWYVPSLDGKLVAVCLSKGGSEDGSVHVFGTATGRELPDVVHRANYGTAGGSLAWNADGSGFWYTRYPRKGERSGRDEFFYQRVYFHRLGTDESEDRYAIGKEFPRIAEVKLESSDDGRYLVAIVENGDGGEYAHYLLSPSGDWKQIARYADQVVAARFGPDGALYLLSRKEAPRGRILRLSPDEPSLNRAEVVVPEGEGAIADYEPTSERLYTSEIVGGPSQLRIFDLSPLLRLQDAGAPPASVEDPARAAVPLGAVPLPPISSVAELVRLQGDEILFRHQTFVDPPSWYAYRPGEPKALPTALRRSSPIAYADAEVTREFAVSKDGARVPINIIRPRKARLDGSNPVLLTGYGGYGISMTPRFLESQRVWIEQGGIYAVANIRGGGEYGDAWHLAGNLTKKQKVFDDFAAAARHLIDAGYTTPERLAIEGGSNGGLLMGASLTQHPELFRAVVSRVGIYDMLRVELAPNGEFNTTEFGTVKNPSQFKALYAYSPYHHVVDGTRYPAVLFMTGANDPRVDPSHSRKMTARLLEATSSGLPVLLRTSSTSGHGIGTSYSERVAEGADIYAFLFDQLGLAYRAIPAAPPEGKPAAAATRETTGKGTAVGGATKRRTTKGRTTGEGKAGGTMSGGTTRGEGKPGGTTTGEANPGGGAPGAR